MTPPSRPQQRAELRGALRANSEALLAYFERRVSPREDAADLLGDTMLHVWRRRRDLPPGDATQQRMWLFTIAGRVLANHRRSSRRRLALTERLRTHLTDAGAVPDPTEANAVRDAVLRLPPRHREIVTLVHWDGFTLAEAAEVLGLNQSTARSRYAAARTKLKNALMEPSRT
ncbi:sigma-70 family RNA polymerase sigma factor [Nocardioides guangzhouensis]|uniref:Sigma-70 family RNA polymerase sigma factor n=1 Tax=Nocardioides guangzhouensis TaxID=2497878 RepID=A0A4Q4ZF81_9ACTN|nr:sigma-70 family RNA polymerase sigma factor [Nocardioides guangzhouensis]RYP86753.1 sigma-70 family RNA polymerase sigma factor [Nocardioides guangzhouensis]